MKAVNISDVDSDKQWAWDIKEQEDFEREFVRRNPLADTIPVRAEWIRRKGVKGNGINRFNPDELVMEQVGEKKEAVGKNWDCPGCGKEFTKNHIGRRKHMQHCKEFLNKRTVH